MRFTLPWPPSTNRYWRNVNGHMLVSREARDYKRTVGCLLNNAGICPREGAVRISISMYRPTKRGDIDNRIKVLLDSMCGYAYVDDAQIVELHAYRFDDRNNPRVEIEIA